MIQISDGTTTIELPRDLQWVDEFDWSDVEQEQDYSLTGALVVQQGVKAKGRPITLRSNAAAWILRSTLEELQGFYNTPETTFTLTYYGDAYQVQFVRPRGLVATEVLRHANPGPDHHYIIDLKFIEV